MTRYAGGMLDNTTDFQLSLSQAGFLASRSGLMVLIGWGPGPNLNGLRGGCAWWHENAGGGGGGGGVVGSGGGGGVPGAGGWT